MKPGSPLGALLGAAVLVAAVTAPAGAQTFNYAAFGDSITWGKCDHPSCANLSAAGYPFRLEDQLACGGSCTVTNKGKSGEETSGGVTRIVTVLDAGNYDVLLLMEGTNDIFNQISNATIEANLATIAQKAKNRNVETVHASIIRINPAGSLNHSRDDEVTDLRDRVSGLASSGNGYFVDTYAVLCPNSTCFDNHYASIDPDQHGLHPNALGYDIMADQFQTEIEKVPVPGTPTPSTPSGDAVPPLSFTWSKESPQRATWYEVSIDGPSGNIFSDWVPERERCSGGACWIDSTLEWTTGQHSWRVRGRNPLGRSLWSADKSFFVYASPPAKATTISPDGSIYSLVPPDITYEWNGVADATDYQLQVESSGGIDVDETYAEGDVCTGNDCTVTPPATLTGGAYTWRVRGSNPAGPALWSTDRDFTIFDSAPAAATPGYPDREIFNTHPLYRWTAAAGATEYDVEVLGMGGTTVALETFGAGACNGTGCSGNVPGLLTPGDYSWEITSRNPLGDGPTSSPVAFTVLDCSPLTVELENQTVSTTETVQACESIDVGNLGAGDYRITSSGDVVLHAGDRVDIHNGFSVDLGGTLEIRTDQ